MATRRQVAAVVIAHGVAAPAGRARWASYGAGVVTPGTVVYGVEVVTEAQIASRTTKLGITLTRFAAGTAIPGAYRVISEGAAE